MSTQVVAKKKKTIRFEMKIDEDWLARAQAEADAADKSLAAYIRDAVREKWERDKVERSRKPDAN